MPDPVAAGSVSFALKDYVTASLALASLAWNYINFKYAKALRSEAFEADEWKTERNEINRAVRDFEDETHLLTTLSTAQHDRIGLLKELTERVKALTVAHGKLAREVERSGVAGIPIGTVYGFDDDGESSWDRINSALADAEELEDVVAMRAKLSVIQGLSREIARSVQSKLSGRRVELMGKKL
jgi:hypothetical protein